MDKWIELVKAKMSELKITQTELAERVGMSQGGIGHWLNKRREPGITEMNRVLKALGMDLPGSGAGDPRTRPTRT
jgi:transcriptional regulator with XRE-family HTH domain